MSVAVCLHMYIVLLLYADSCHFVSRKISVLYSQCHCCVTVVVGNFVLSNVAYQVITSVKQSQ